MTSLKPITDAYAKAHCNEQPGINSILKFYRLVLSQHIIIGSKSYMYNMGKSSYSKFYKYI